MIEEIHCEGALVCVGKIQGGTVEEAVAKAKKYEDMGYDVVEVGERGWSGIEAVRADLKIMEAIRKSTDLLIEAVILPRTPGKSRGPATGPNNMPAMHLLIKAGPTGSSPWIFMPGRFRDFSTFRWTKKASSYR